MSWPWISWQSLSDWLHVSDQKFWVRLTVFKDDKQGRVAHIITARVKQNVRAKGVLGWWPIQWTVTISVGTYQYSSQKHLFVTPICNLTRSVAVWVVGLRSEITSLSILCAVLAAHSPVKALLADRVSSLGFSTMEQLPFFGIAASLFGHAAFFPAK